MENWKKCRQLLIIFKKLKIRENNLRENETRLELTKYSLELKF